MTNEIEQLTRSLQAYKGLVEVSALINEITDFEELLSAILDVAKRVMKAEASSLFLVDDKGNLHLAIARNPRGEFKDSHIVVPRGKGIAGWVLEHGKSQLVPDAYADPRFFSDVDKKSGFRTRSIVCVPLRRGEREIGVLQALNPQDKESFDQTDLDAFEAYGSLASTAIEKLRAARRQREQDRVDRELELAREIQAGFLPSQLPTLAGMSFAATYQPARNIGGDFYDLLPATTDEIYFVIGDVSGKGIPAALLMAQSLSALRFIVKAGTPPADALARWNDSLCGPTVRGMFITAIIGRIVPSLRQVEFANAGHPHPLKISRAGVSEVAVASGPPLGIIAGQIYENTGFTLDAHEWVALYTDGLSESASADGGHLDNAGIASLLDRDFESAQEIVNALIEGEQLHRGQQDLRDDLTILSFGFQ